MGNCNLQTIISLGILSVKIQVRVKHKWPLSYTFRLPVNCNFRGIYSIFLKDSCPPVPEKPLSHTQKT